MRGFRPGALVGDTGATLTLVYQWPVWGDWLDARAHVSLGNVYDDRFEDFAPGNQRMSFGIGLGAVDELDHYFDFTLAWGTETFEQGFQVTTFRLAIGGEWSI
jgi:hemolysin activation/secretion protein